MATYKPEKQPDSFLAFIPVKVLGRLCVYLIKSVFIEYNESEEHRGEIFMRVVGMKVQSGCMGKTESSCWVCLFFQRSGK